MSKFCVVEGTQITLNNYSKKTIEEIMIGENILVFDLETIQRTQKYDILLKLKSKNFKGVFKESQVKNIWTNNVKEYYLINNSLKITGDHILLCYRDDTYFWIKVENLLLNDYLFTEENIFEMVKTIEKINESINVYNLEVNSYYNYFASNYLIHNGAPCSACLVCGKTFGNFVFAPHDIASHHHDDDADGTNNWISVRSSSETEVVIDGDTWSDSTDQNTFPELSKLISKIETDAPLSSEYKGVADFDDWKYSRKVHLEGNDTNPQYSCRGGLPIINQNDDVKFYVKIKHIGSGGAGGSTTYNLWGIGLMRKFSSFEDVTDKDVDTSDTNILNSWNTTNTNAAAPYALEPQESANPPATSNSLIFGNTKILIRMLGDTNLYIKDIEVPFYGRLKQAYTNDDTFRINSFFGLLNSSDSEIATILNTYRVIGLGQNIPLQTTSINTTSTPGEYEIILSSGNITGITGDYVGFTLLTGDFSSTSVDDGGQPSGMGYNYNKSYGTDSNPKGESLGFSDWADRGSSDSTPQPLNTSSINTPKINSTKLNDLIILGGVVGFEITSATSVQPNRSIGDKIRLITFYGQKDSVDLGNGSGNKIKLTEKELPELYFDKNKKLNLMSDLNSDSSVDGCWSILVFDSTSANNTERDVTLEIINPI
jgi:intein/homing endonuclease